MVGSDIWRELTAKGYMNLIGKSSSELELHNQQAGNDFCGSERTEAAIDAASRFWRYLANNDYLYHFLMENRHKQNNLTDVARRKYKNSERKQTQ